MSARVDPATHQPFLSREEERVLVVIRGIAACTRSSRGSLCLPALAAALGQAGAVPCQEGAAVESLAFALGSVRFVLSARAVPHEGVELNFIA